MTTTADWKWESRFKGCNLKNQKAKYSNYICNPPTRHWVKLKSQRGVQVIEKIEENPRNCQQVNPKSGQGDYVCNPATGRWVHKEGRLGQLLVKHYSKLVYGKIKAPKPEKAAKSSLQALKKTITVVIPGLPPQYKAIKKIGSGLFGQIYLASENVSGQKVVIKKYKDYVDPGTAEKMKNQIVALSKLQSEHLLNYLDSFYNENGEFFIIMEYFDGHNLTDLDINKMATEDKMQIILQLILGLHDLHVEYNLSHQDIKPSNIMISNDGTTVRYIGYGLTFDFDSWKKNYNLSSGAPYYRPPEQILQNVEKSLKEIPLAKKKTQSLPQLFKAGDIWSLGAVIYYILTGRHAFEKFSQQSIEEINQQILNTEPDYSSLPLEFSKNENFQIMLAGMFTKDRKKRLDIEAVMDLYEKAYKEIIQEEGGNAP